MYFLINEEIITRLLINEKKVEFDEKWKKENGSNLEEYSPNQIFLYY